MKALLRAWNDDRYVWKDVEIGEHFLKLDTRELEERDVVALADFAPNAYVKCGSCGKIFQRESEEWANHVAKTTDTSKCFKCQWLRSSNQVIKSKTYQHLENGKYAVLTTSEEKLVCRQTYPYLEIDNPECRETCIHNKCANANANPVTNFFTEHPGVFDDIITTDVILEHGYKEMCNAYGEICFKLKGKNTIYACANNMNIVDHFKVGYRNESWTVYYSKRYDKLYSIGINGCYNEWAPYQLTDETKQYIHKKIAELYN